MSIIPGIETLAPDLTDNKRGFFKSPNFLDTSFSIQLSQASDIIKKGLEDYGKALKKIAIKHKHTVCIGRSHGIHAETTTFGLKILGYFEENKRNLERLKRAINQIQTIQMSGPIGTYSNIDQRVEKLTPYFF